MRYGAAFVVLMVAGLAVWVLSTPSAAVILFGDDGYEAAYSSPIYGFLGLPLLALPPLVAGFVLPKGSWRGGLRRFYLICPAWCGAIREPDRGYVSYPEP